MNAEPVAALRAYLDVGDREAYDEFGVWLHDDVVVHAAGGVTTRGLPAVTEAWTAAHAGLHGLRHEVVEGVGGDGVGAVRLRVTATHGGIFLGVPASGRQIDIDQAVFARMSGDRIAELWEIADTGAGLQQLGLLTDQPLSP